MADKPQIPYRRMEYPNSPEGLPPAGPGLPSNFHHVYSTTAINNHGPPPPLPAPRKVHSMSSLRFAEDKEPEHTTEQRDSSALDNRALSLESLEDPVESLESLENIDSDPDLRLLEVEPERWVNTVSKEVLNGLTQRQIKKQEHIYELIITEKNHCLLLKVMKEVFFKGMLSQLGMKETQVKSILPCLDDLITIHSTFLWTLRECQRNNRYIPSIGDILVQQFTGYGAKGLKYSYGAFCSGHQDAVSHYKDLLKTDKRFQSFIRTTSGHRLMKKKGIPEGILFIAHRVTKYPLMLEALIKYTNDQPDETEKLQKALISVKDILVNINSQVAEREKRRRLVEMYDKIDVKSSVVFGADKFKKSHLLSGGRKLVFEGHAVWSLHPGKYQSVMVVVMSDLVFFLQEHNQKYYFVSPDSKSGAFPLERLVAKERGGTDTRTIVLYNDTISELVEFECIHPKDRRIWMSVFKEGINACKDDGRWSFGQVKLKESDIDNVKCNVEKIFDHYDSINGTCRAIEDDVSELTKLLGFEEFLSCPKFVPRDDISNKRHEDTTKSLENTVRLAKDTSSWGRGLASSLQTIAETIESSLDHRQKMEQLRRQQTRLSHERSAFTREREQHDRYINEEKDEIRRQQESLKARQEDINQQRDDLYKKLEALRPYGIGLSPSLTVVPSNPLPVSNTTVQRASTFVSHPTVTRTFAQTLPHDATPPGRGIKHRYSSATMPSASRDRQSATPPSGGKKPPIKQQLPMKLASLGSSGTS